MISLPIYPYVSLLSSKIISLLISELSSSISTQRGCTMHAINASELFSLRALIAGVVKRISPNQFGSIISILFISSHKYVMTDYNIIHVNSYGSCLLPSQHRYFCHKFKSVAKKSNVLLKAEPETYYRLSSFSIIITVLFYPRIKATCLYPKAKRLSDVLDIRNLLIAYISSSG